MNTNPNTAAYDPDNNFGSTAIFSSIRKTIFSKDFKSGSITNIFGTTVVDLANGEISGIGVLYINQVMSETKIIVPQDWRVEAELSQLFSNVIDKRINLYQTYHSNKLLIIRGYSTMANVKVKSAPWLNEDQE